jgi:hypothetical protein
LWAREEGEEGALDLRLWGVEKEGASARWRDKLLSHHGATVGRVLIHGVDLNMLHDVCFYLPLLHCFGQVMS